MKTLNAVLRELAGLFIDDGFLALAIVAVVVAAGIVAALPPPGSRVAGAILAFGCIAVLAVSALRGRAR
jgi:hypothetical protein